MKLLYGSVASAMGAFVAGGLTVPPKPGGRRLDEVVTRWRLVADVTQRACRDESDRHDFWRLAGVTAWCTVLLVRGLEQGGRMPEELIQHLVQVAILSTFARPIAAASDDEDDGGSGHGSAGMSSACARSRGSGLCEGKVLYRGDPVGTLAIRRYVR